MKLSNIFITYFWKHEREIDAYRKLQLKYANKIDMTTLARYSREIDIKFSRIWADAIRWKISYAMKIECDHQNKLIFHFQNLFGGLELFYVIALCNLQAMEAFRNCPIYYLSRHKFGSNQASQGCKLSVAPHSILSFGWSSIICTLLVDPIFWRKESW